MRPPTTDEKIFNYCMLMCVLIVLLLHATGPAAWAIAAALGGMGARMGYLCMQDAQAVQEGAQ